MKTDKLFFGLVAGSLVLAGMTQSCVSEEPFGNGDGEAKLRMQVVLNSDITRAVGDVNDLSDNCIIYLSGGDGQGLLYKYHGIGEVPTDGITLKSGNYVLEGWAGDSVPASFEKKFYRGYNKFYLESGSERAEKLTCRIANVVVSVDPSTVVKDLMAEWNVKVFNTTGSLDFNPENAAESKGYYMMSSRDIAYGYNNNHLTDEDGWSMYTNLYYTVIGKTPDGRSFEKTGLIGKELAGTTVVEHAHEYVLKFQYNPQYEEQGGSLISIVVEDNPIVDNQEIGLYSAPAIKGVNFDITRQITGDVKSFGNYVVKVAGFNGLEIIRMSMSKEDAAAFGLPKESFNLRDLADSDVEKLLKTSGLNWEYTPVEDRTKVSKSFIYFNQQFLNNLDKRDHDYQITIYAKDGNGRESTETVRIAVGDEAVVAEDPVLLEAVDTNVAPMSVLATQATIKGSFDSEAINPRIMYKMVSAPDNSWSSVPVRASRASEEFSITLSGLQPGTEYMYKAATDDWTSTTVSRFKTEEVYVIPFADMETWSAANDNNAIQFPGSNYVESTQFWDSGNHGSATLNATLTKGSTVMNHTPNGSKSAELKSQYVNLFGIGKFAAGNLFMGRFGATIGTNGAMLTFGKPYNGSHPSKMTVWVSYTPGKVDYVDKSCPFSFTKNTDYDHGQIYVALTTEPISVNTGNKDSNGVKAGTFMNFDDPRILGFGEMTWKDGNAHGTPTSLEKLEIPILWRDGAKTKKPVYLIIVCSASKYGDYFTGSSKSIMYVDDFELVY